MDRSEEEMKFVGFFGIFKQSFKTIIKFKKIFTQITLTLILPLTIVFFAHMIISNILFYKIESNAILLDPDTNRGRATIKDLLFFWLFKVIYFTILAIFSFLSTATVVFTVASVYTGREIEYKKVIKVAPKIGFRVFGFWFGFDVSYPHRLPFRVFIGIYLTHFFYDIMGGGVMALCRANFGFSIWILIIHFFCFLYLSVLWQLASVVTVLEKSHGFKAMKKGWDLMKGKKKLGMGISFVLYLVLAGIVLVYELFVEYGDEIFKLQMIWRVLMGILCGFLLMILFLLTFVIQTMLYLVCKSHHREAIDKLSLSTLLAAYSGETVVYPNAGEEIQLGRPRAESV